MDHASLVALITERVVEELTRGTPPPAPSELRSGGRRVLVVGAPGSSVEAAAWQALRPAERLRWVAVDWPGFPAARVERGLGRAPAAAVEPPELWDELVGSVEAVVLPVAPLPVLARTATLLADCPPVGAAVAALVQGVPVFFGNGDTERLTRHSSRIPGGLLSVVQQHVRTVQGMGVRLEAPAQIATALQGGVARPAAAPSGGRDVVTNEDVEAAARAGRKIVEVASGSIVTP